MARVVELIEVDDRRGLGTPDNPVRMVRQWWTFDGTLVVEVFDPYTAPPKEAKE